MMLTSTSIACPNSTGVTHSRSRDTTIKRSRRSVSKRFFSLTCQAQQSTATTLSEISLSTGSKRIVHLDGRTVADTDIDVTASDIETTVVDFAPLTAFQSLFLPRGWPNTVTPDYVRYQLCTIPAHITGWMSYALAGSSMLKALGVGISPAGAVGFSAGIKWVTKDGLGAIGRMVVGGGLATKFDEDPRRWRMIAELITTTGLALEIATQIYPVNFVALAGTGNLCKAIGKGMGRPCFRVVQTHFAAANNVGDVAAKEEIWEVSAQLLGLAASVALLTAIEASGNPEAILPVWASVHSVHVAFRYFSLKTLEFPYLNMKRATALVKAHVAGQRLGTPAEVNSVEPIWQGPGACTPQVVLGCSIDEAFIGTHHHDHHSHRHHSVSTTTGNGAQPVGASTSSNGNDSNSNGASSNANESTTNSVRTELAEVVTLFQDEKYILTWNNGVAKVVLWDNAQPLDMLKSIWQAAWLEKNIGMNTADKTVLKESIEAMKVGFSEFCDAAEAEGWQLHRTVLPLGPIRLQTSV